MAKYTQPPISVAKQYFSLKHKLNGNGKVQRGNLSWKYKTKPTPFSRTYTILITYKLGQSPNVYVTDPNLDELSAGREIPHLYNNKNKRLCLYLPASGQWNKYMLLSDTIVPWVSLWLFFFEEWLFSNIWKGGGKHPVIDKNTNNL